MNEFIVHWSSVIIPLVMWEKITGYSLRNRLLILAAAVAIMIVGYMVLQRTPIDVFPDINDPRVTILTEAPGWSPEEVETLVTFPLESAFNGAPFVKRVRSSSGIGISVVFIEFEWGTDIFKARQLVSERLQTVTLPGGVESPLMAPISSRLGEIVEFALENESGKMSQMDLRDVADWMIRFRLQTIGGISNVINLGGLVRQYQVLVSPERLLKYELTLLDVREALEKGNMNSAGGFLVKPTQEYLIQGIGRIQSLEDLQNIVITTQEGGIPVFMKDVAEVKIDGSLTRRGAGSLNGKETVLGKIVKQPGTNTLEITQKILAAFKDLEKALPEGLKIRPEYLQANLIARAVANVKEALIEGAILVVIILMLFLYNFRTTVIALTAIPLSLILTGIVLYWYDLNVNIMTLAGLAIAVGLVVDDAIIYVENIFRRLREYFFLEARDWGLGVSNKPQASCLKPQEIVLTASNEIVSGVVSATIIIILVFVPLITLEGIEGRLFAPLGIAVMVSMGASLLVAVTVTPVLGDLLLTHKKALNEKESPVVRGIKSVYQPLLKALMRHSKKVIGITILLIIGSIFLIPLMGREFLPIMDEGTMLINATLPPGTSLEESKRIGDQIEKALHEFPEVVSTSNRTGRAEEDEHAEGVNSNEIVVNLLPPEKRKKSREELLTLFRERLKEFSGVVVNIGQPIQHRLDHLLSGVNAQLAIKLFGSDLNVLRAKAEEIRRAISTVPGVADLFVEQQVEVPQLKIWINRKEAARYGLSVTDISHFVETAFKGETVSQILQGQRRYNLVAILESQSRSDVEKIKQLLINTPSGSVVPLERVTDIQFEPGPTTINRENVSRMMVVQCNVSGRDLGGFVNEVQARINKNVSFPEGYFVSYGGQFESQQRAFQKLLIELFFIVLAMYVLLYVTLGSGRIALLVMLNVPLSLIGGIVAIYLVSGVLSVSSFSGFILLFGIAMRNGIILVTHINDLRYKEGLGLLDAILKGTNDRLSPVLMTALAAGLGMVPLAIAQGSGAELQKPLAIVIVGGMLTSTALTLLVLPVLYYLAEKRGENQKPPENLEEPKPGVLKPEALPTVQEVMKF